MSLEGWGYRKLHVLSGVDVTGYQVKIRVYRAEGSDSGDTVYVGSKCLESFGDIRFTESDKTTELSYWIENIESTYADFWVKTSVATAGTEIYIYYGNLAATTTSSGDNTFEFFDDFAGTTIDETKWNPELITHDGGGGTITVDDAVTITQLYNSTSSSLVSQNALTSNECAVRAKINARSSSVPTSAEIKLMLDANSGAPASGVFGCLWVGSNNRIYYHNGKDVGNPYASEVLTTSTPAVYDCEMNVDNPALSKNGTVICQGTGNPTGPVDNYIRIFCYHRNTSITIDWIAVRKRAAKTPVHGDWGEETVPVEYPFVSNYHLGLIDKQFQSIYEYGATCVFVSCYPTETLHEFTSKYNLNAITHFTSIYNIILSIDFMTCVTQAGGNKVEFRTRVESARRTIAPMFEEDV